VTRSHDDQIAQRYEGCVLPAGTDHVVRLIGHWKPRGSVDSEAAAVDRPAVGNPDTMVGSSKKSDFLR